MALLRVKRRPHEDPIDALLLACKKQKTDEGESFSTVFKFAGTVEEKNKDSDLASHVNTAKDSYNTDGATKDPIKKQRQVKDITDKLRAENKLFSQNNRLKVINCFRHAEGEGDTTDLTVIDIESNSLGGKETADVQTADHTLPSDVRTTEEQYVYDLYYSNEGAFDEIQIEHMISAHPVDELMFDFGPQSEDEEERAMDDEDDSNDENNWRNDYPDEMSSDAGSEKSTGDGDVLSDLLGRFRMDSEDRGCRRSSPSRLSSSSDDDIDLYDDDDITNHRHPYLSDSLSSTHYYCTSSPVYFSSSSEYD